MRNLLLSLFLLLSLHAFGQGLPVQKGEKWIFHDSLNVDDGFKVGYKSGAPATSNYYTRFNQTGRLFYYNDVTPSLGMLLKGNGTYYDNFAKGTSRQYLRVNAAGTDLEWTKLKKADFDDLAAFQILYGNTSGNGQVEQDPNFYYDNVTLGVPAQIIQNTEGGVFLSTLGFLETLTNGNSYGNFTPRELNFNWLDGGGSTYAGTFSPELMHLTYAPAGVATNQLIAKADYLSWWVSGAFETRVYRTTGGSLYSLYLPNSQGAANTTLRNDGAGNLTWVAFGPGTVTDFSFIDDNGFVGEVATSTTTPTLTISTDVGLTQVPFVYENPDGIHRGFTGVPEFYFNGVDLELHLDGLNADLFVGGETYLGTTTPTRFMSDGRIDLYAGTTTSPGSMLIGDASSGGIMKILNAGTAGQELRVKADLEPEWYDEIYSFPLSQTSGLTDKTVSILGLSTVGTAGQMVRTNAGATGWEYFTPTFGSGTVTNVELAVTNLSGAGATTSVTGSPITSSGTFTLNIPDAGISVQRGLVTDAIQSFAGAKTFNNTVTFNDDGIFVDVAFFGTDKTKFDTNGRMYLYNNQTPAAGMLLKGDGTDYKNLARGSAGQILSVNSGGTDVEWKTHSGYTLQFAGAQFNPTAANTYYIGGNPQSAGTTAGRNRIYILRDGTITSATIMFDNNGTLSTTEVSTVSIRLNNTTDYTLTSSATNDARPTVFSNASMSVPVVAGDYIEIKWSTPATWATSPTQVRPQGVFNIQ